MEKSLPLIILRIQKYFLTSCGLKSTDYRTFIEAM